MGRFLLVKWLELISELAGSMDAAWSTIFFSQKFVFERNAGRNRYFRILHMGLCWKQKIQMFTFEECQNQKTCNYEITS